MKQTFKFLTLSRVFNDCRDSVGRLSTLILLLTLLLGFTPNAWGYNFKNPYIYFNNADLNWNPAMLLVGHNNGNGYSAGYNQTSNPLADTKLVYFHPTANWGDQDGFTIANTKDWGASETKYDTRVGYLDNQSIAHLGTQWSYGFDEKTYYVTGSANSASRSINVSYCSGGHSALPKKNATSAVKVRTSSSASYTNVTGTWPAKINLKGTYMSGDGKTDRSTISSTAGNSQESDRVYGVVITGKVSMSYENLSNDYTFDGWGESTPSNTADYYITDDKTIYAFFTAKHTVTFDTPGNGSLGAKISSTSISSGTKQADGSKIVFTATPSTGYEVEGWYSNSTCTSQIAGTGTETTYTINSLTADATVYVKFKKSNYSITYTPSPAVNFTYTTAPDNADYNTTVNMTVTPATNYVIAGVTVYKTGDESTKVTVTREGETNNYSFTQPAYDVTVEVSVSLSQVQVTYGTNGSGQIIGKVGGTSIGDSPTKVNGGSTVEFTATPSAGYKVIGFYSDEECTDANKLQSSAVAEGSSDTYTINNISDDASVYAKFDYIDYTIAMAVNPSGKGTITPSSVTQAHINVPFTISASNTEGYTFSQWTSTNNITITTGGTTTATLTNVTCDKTITANFTEDMHSVAVVSENTSKGTVSTASVSNIGIDTKSGDIIATPNPGYYFTGWDIPSGVTLAAGYTNKSATIKINATADEKTITANFAERFYLRGSIQNKADTETGGMPGWGDDAKDSGKGLFTTIDGNTATITKNLEASTTYKLKLGDLQGKCSWGGSNDFKSGADLWEFTCNTQDGCAAPTFTTAIAGTYTFTIDFSEASPKMKITYPDVPDYTLTVAKTRVFGESTLAFIDGDGTENNPYKFYLDEKMHLEVTALTPITGAQTWYEFGKDFSPSIRTKDITVNSIEKQSIVVKTYYGEGSYKSREKTETIYYQGVAVPALHLHSSLTNDEVEKGSAPDKVTIYYTTENYTGAATITKNNAAWETVESGSQWNKEETLENTIHSDTYVATATPNERTFTATLAVSVYKYVQVKVKDADPKWAKNVYMWKSGTDKKNAEWPGEALSTQLGDWYIFAVKYPTYDKFVVNDGKTTGKQTIDLDIPAEDICYQIGAEQSGTDGKHIYNCTTGDCPNGLYVGDIADVEMCNGESATASPVVQLDPTLDEKNLSISFTYGNSGIVTATQSGTKIMLSAIKAGTTTVTATYSITGAESVSKNFTVTVNGAVMIQAKYSESGLGWGGADMHIHYWGTDINETIDLTWKGKVGEISQVYARIPLDKNNQINFQIYAWNMDNDKQWHITNDVTNVTESGCYEITSDGDGKKRNITRTGDYCWAEYQVKIVMNNGTVYTSNTIGDTDETLSFFAPGENAEGYNRGDVYLMCNGSQKAVIPSSTFATSGVYIATINDTYNGLDDVALYTGDYYIRTDGASGGWDNYKTNADNKFTKFDKIETSTYDRYWVKNLKHAQDKLNVNIQACVANDYNENLANKIEASAYTDEYGNVFPSEYGVNVRFGYDPSTNNFERAIIKGAGDNDFLNVIGDNVYKEKACSTLLNTQNENSKFVDKEQWIYEKDVYVKIDATHISSVAKLQSKAFNDNVMYQLGYEIDPITGKPTTTPKTFGLIAMGTTEGTYKIHLVYDFKTNRMVSGWSPSDNPIDGTIVLDADILLVRNHQESAAQIKFVDNSSSIQQIHHIYGVMEIEKAKIQDPEISNYERHLYWISFPFDVKISSIFGVGTYGVEWKLQRYDGAERASKGWFKGDGTTTFWKNMTIDETLNAYEGYILNLKPSAFDYDNCPVWDNKRTIATFYFPSVDGNVGLIKAATYEQKVPEHECKINREFEVDSKMQNHTITDSHWNVIGVPAFENATVSAQEESQDFKSYYAWDASNNTYSAGIVSGTEFKAMHAYMVQFYGKIIWSNVSVILKAPYAYADEKNYMIELFFNGNGAEDHTYVKLADGAHTDFELNEDMMKIDNAGQPNIYSFAGNYNVAYNETKMENQTVMLGVSAPKDGSYTFSMPKDFSGKAVLVDLEDGTTTDLNLSNYTIELNKGTYNNRFQLMLEVEAKIPTNIENANGGLWSEDGKTQKLLINDQIYLINGGRVYNVLGVEE